MEGTKDTLGSLSITVFSGKLVRDTEAFGKMDPFVTIEYNTNIYKTKVDYNSGKSPVWE